MKKLKLFLPLLVCIMAVGAAFATTTDNLVVEIWRKNQLGICQPTVCVLEIGPPCDETNFTYHIDEECESAQVMPFYP